MCPQANHFTFGASVSLSARWGASFEKGFQSYRGDTLYDCRVRRGREGATYVGVAVSQDFVQNVAELPAEDGAAGKGKANRVGPESKCSFLMVSSQDNSFPEVKVN